jgi:hypothetical protein
MNGFLDAATLLEAFAPKLLRRTLFSFASRRVVVAAKGGSPS